MAKSTSFFDEKVLSMKSVEAIVILDSAGKRIFAKYYSPRPFKKQTDFERELFKRTRRVSNEVLLLEDFVVVYKNHMDVLFYIAGTQEENELILLGVLETLFDALIILTENQLDKRSLLEHASLLFILMDELVDGGVILDTDPEKILDHITFRQRESESMSTEQTIAQALRFAKTQVKAFLK